MKAEFDACRLRSSFKYLMCQRDIYGDIEKCTANGTNSMIMS